MSCADKKSRVIGVEEVETSTVYLFDDSMKPSKEIKTVHVSYAYDSTHGQTIII